MLDSTHAMGLLHVYQVVERNSQAQNGPDHYLFQLLHVRPHQLLLALKFQFVVLLLAALRYWYQVNIHLHKWH